MLTINMIQPYKKTIGQKEKNVLRVLEVIASAEERDAVAIIKKTKLSSSTVSRATDRLERLGIIVTEEREVDGAGRRPEIYRLNATYGYLIFFDMCTTEINGYLTNLKGDILQECNSAVSKQLSMEMLISILQETYQQLLLKARVKAAQVLAAGISVPGVVNEANMRIERIPNICPFRDANVYESILNLLSVPVVINNVSNLALMGEKIKAFPHCKDMAYISLTDHYGVGGGVMINNEIVQGKRHAAGEIGDMFFDLRNFDTEYRENMGCLESNASLKSLYDKVQKMVDAGRGSVIKQMLQEEANTLSLELIERAVRQHDYDVEEAFDDTMKIWSSAIINLCSIIDPEVVVIGGRITHTNTLAWEKIKYFVSKGLYYEPNIQFSVLGNEAQIYGGIFELKKYVLSELLSKIL